MKRISLLISAALLSLIAGVQTAMAQKVMLYMTGNQAVEYDIAQLDSIVFCEGQTIPADEIVVTVDTNGNADGGHRFEKIDETHFYIDDIKYTAQNGDLVVTGYYNAFFKGAANIISVLKYRGRTLNVVSIKEKAFQDCSSLTSITISTSVTGIGSSAFEGCSSLTSITIPESVTSIGQRAFYGCRSLTSITIPKSVTSIGEWVFYDCGRLASVTLESNNIVSAARDYNSSMRTIFGDQVEEYIIGNSVTCIGKYAFEYCRNLTSITIPESVTSIGEWAFSNCSSLSSVTIPNSVNSIGDEAFQNCFFKTESFVNNSSLTSDDNWGATLCDEETSDGLVIKNNIVVRCRVWAVSITIPESVTSISNAAFWSCSSLTSVTIGSGVTSIGSSAFSQCSSLTDVYCYAENVPSTDDNVFSSTPISSATLHVPAGSVDAYKAAGPWKNFGTIVAIE